MDERANSSHAPILSRTIAFVAFNAFFLVLAAKSYYCDTKLMLL